MFAAFFYLLRQRGLDVSLNEWMTLLEGMEKGLHHSSLTGFYHLCRAVVVKSETEFDRFLLQKDGLLPPHRQPVYKYLTLTRGERATAAALYPDLRPGAFGWCLRNMSNVYRLAASRNRKFSRAILGLGGKKGRALLMTAGPNPQYAHLDAPILALYEEAAAAFPAMAQALAAAIENETPFGEEFTPAFG